MTAPVTVQTASTATTVMVKFLDAWLGAHALEGDQPGFTVVIRQAGEEIYARAFGSDDVHGSAPLSLDALYNIGSQSKMLTAVLCMQLVERGKLALDDTIGVHLPWVAEHADPRMQYVTIRQLLWHGSGLVREGVVADYWILRAPFPDAAYVRQAVLDSHLILDSAVKLKYSNLGYALLGLILEAASGRSYGSLAEGRIIRPLALQHTYPEYTDVIEPRIVTGYTRQLAGKRVALPRAIATNAFAPTTGWYVSAGELARLMEIIGSESIGSPRLLTPVSQKAMLQGSRNHWLAPTEQGTAYGLGIMRLQLDDDQAVVGHSGAFIGHQTCSYIDVKRNLVVVVMANARDTPVNQMAFGIFDALRYFETDADVEVPPEKMKLNMCLRNMLGTKYIVATGGRIASVPLDDWAPFDAGEALEAIDDATLRIVSADDLSFDGETITLQRDDAGEVTHINYAGISMWRTTP